MSQTPDSLKNHRVQASAGVSVMDGEVRFSPSNALWFGGMAIAAIVGGIATFSWAAFGVFVLATAVVLLLGHSLGSHRKFIHNSFQCPKWLEYFLVYMGVQVGLAGPLGLMRQHELRDYAQRLPDCHDYLRHGSVWWRDAWWQLMCELRLHRPPPIAIEASVASDAFYKLLEKTWRLQQLLPAVPLYAIGGWGFVFWGVCARVSVGVGGHWLIGYFAHNHGQMNYRVDGAAVQGRNIPLTSLVTMGECWHNNHHAFPGSARLGLFPGEWDAGWWVLVLLSKVGLVWDVRLPADLPRREELHACHGLLTSDPTRVQTENAHPAASMTFLMGSMRKRLAGVDLTGPGSMLTLHSSSWLLGRHVRFSCDPSVSRVEANLGGTRVTGLPALCLGLATGPAPARLLGFCLMPLAISAEQLRRTFTAIQRA